MEKIKKYNKNADADEAKIYEAYLRCRQQHSNQLRHSGEPYYVHPCEVASILADMELDAETIIHSDQGCHYTSVKFIQIIKDVGLRQSMSRKGNCWDNSPQESFYGHMKDEIDLSKCATFEEVKTIIDDWICYYNTERYQWDLAKLSPDEYYEYVTTGEYPLPIYIPK